MEADDVGLRAVQMVQVFEDVLYDFDPSADVPTAAAHAAAAGLEAPALIVLAGLNRRDRNGKARAIRDRRAPEAYEHLIEAVHTGVPKRQLATQFGTSLRSIYRLPVRG